MNLPFFILGGGSNVLFSDKGFDGIIIKTENSKIKIKNNFIIAEAGAKLSDIVNLAQKNSLTGIEWAAGIYGTIGGAIRGCAGAFEGDISFVIKEVEAIDLKIQKIKIFSNKECGFEYRNSIFKKNKNFVIISAIIELKKGKKEKIKKLMEKHRQYRKEHHPLNFPSAGSVFESIDIKKFNKEILKKFPEIKDFSNQVPAGFLIEKAGLKGKIIGKAQVSRKHANFIINLGGARAQDVLDLINFIKKQVKEIFKINLKEEIFLIKDFHN